MKIVKDEIYIVREGDTIASIANEYGVNPTLIMLSNNISPKMITAGKVLYIKKN